MPGRTVSGVIPPKLYDAAQAVTEYDGSTVSALVSSALTLYLGLSGAARRSARYVLASDVPESRDILLDGCGRAIAQAVDHVLAEQLAAKGREMGLSGQDVSEQEIEQAAASAVRETRRARRAAATGHAAPPRRMNR